jgi:nucleoside-diphosphate-sugar epimerase
LAQPDVVVFAAGAGGKPSSGSKNGGDGDAKSRTRKVDYEGAVKVYDAMEGANVRRLILVGAVDIRDRGGEVPGWYDEEDGMSTH